MAAAFYFFLLLTSAVFLGAVVQTHGGWAESQELGQLAALVFWSVGWSAFGCAVGQRRGLGFVGGAAGFLLGPFGLAVPMLARDRRPHCAACDQPVSPQARVCHWCGTETAGGRRARVREASSEALAPPSPAVTSGGRDVRCKSCLRLRPRDASTCPHCGAQ